MRDIRVGTRNSSLALKQTHLVIEMLKKQHPNYTFHIQEIVTEGDKKRDISLAQLGRGVFLEEIEERLLAGDIDMAVHSLKDIPVDVPKGLKIAAIPKREDHRDAYIANDHIAFKDLPSGALIGTSSVRRSAQLLAQRPDIQTKWIRGPIDDRVSQLRHGDFAAIILAVAGIKRLGLGEHLITEYLADDHFVPAMGQGALAIECRADDELMCNLLSTIHDDDTSRAVMTERLFLQAFDEGEQAPIGGYAFIQEGYIHLRGMVISLDGKTVLQHEAVGDDPATLAETVATHLINQGAMEVIAETNEALQKE